MLRFPSVVCIMVFGAVLTTWHNVNATTVFFDDFESADAIGTIIPDTPPVGEDWVTRNLGSVLSNIAANPEIEDRNSSDLVYRMHRTSARPVAIMLAPISAANSALIAANTKATIEFKYYEPAQTTNAAGQTVDNLGGISWIANEAPAVPGTLPVNSSVGFTAANGGFAQTGYGNVGGANYTDDNWHDLRFDVDFTAKNYTLTVNGVTAPAPISFTDATAATDTLTHLWLSYPQDGSDFYIDDLRITSVPEPSTCALATLSLLGIVARPRRARIRNL